MAQLGELLKDWGARDKDKSREKGNFSRNKIRLLMYCRASSCVVKTVFDEGFTLGIYKTKLRRVFIFEMSVFPT